MPATSPLPCLVPAIIDAHARASRFQAAEGWEAQEGLIAKDDGPRHETHLAGRLRAPIREPGRVEDIGRRGRHVRLEDRALGVLLDKREGIRVRWLAFGTNVDAADHAIPVFSGHAEIELDLVADRPNFLGRAFQLDRMRHIHRHQGLTSQQRETDVGPDREGESEKDQDRHQDEAGPFQTRMIGDLGETADALRHLFRFLGDDADELLRHAIELGARLIELHGADEPMLELRDLAFDPEREQRVGEPAHLGPKDEQKPGDRGGHHLQGEQADAHAERRLALAIDQPIDEAAQSQEDEDDREPARRAPDEGEQAFAIPQASEVMFDRGWDHVHYFR